MFYQKKGLLQIEYSPLDSELEKQTDISKEQYQGLGKVYEFHKTSEKKFKKVLKNQHLKIMINQI